MKYRNDYSYNDSDDFQDIDLDSDADDYYDDI